MYIYVYFKYIYIYIYTYIYDIHTISIALKTEPLKGGTFLPADRVLYVISFWGLVERKGKG
jgi:hypothetical protein